MKIHPNREAPRCLPCGVRDPLLEQGCPAKYGFIAPEVNSQGFGDWRLGLVVAASSFWCIRWGRVGQVGWPSELAQSLWFDLTARLHGSCACAASWHRL